MIKKIRQLRNIIHEYNLNTVIPLFCLSIASIRSKSLKSEGLIGLETDVISLPRLLEAALILESAGFPFNSNKNHKSGRRFIVFVTVVLLPNF